MKKVSIIVPVYKGNRYIASLIRMAEDNWEYANHVEEVVLELVLVNDYPNEDFIIADEMIRNIFLQKITNEKNMGIHASRVEGLLHAKGDYIIFLDQDDEISRIYVREQLKALEDLDAVVCNGKICSRFIYQSDAEMKKALNADEYRNGCNRIVSPGQVLLRREAIPEEWKTCILQKNGADDYFLWLLMFWKKCRIGINDKILYCHLFSGENTSNDLEGMNQSVYEMVDKLIEKKVLINAQGKKIKESRITGDRKEDITYAMYQKELCYKRILEFWMVLRERKIFAAAFLQKRNIQNIAIYGKGILGRHLYYELRESSIKVECFLDKNVDVDMACGYTVIPGTSIKKVDAIIVTPIMEFREIREKLQKFYACEIISLETVLFNADCELVV